MKTDTFMMKAFLQGLAITVLTLSVPLPVISGEAEHSGNTRMSQSVPVITFVNYQDAYRFTVFLNDEPLVSGTGLLLFDWRGYPIRTGTNVIRFEAVALVDNPATPVYGRINLSGPAQKEIAVIRNLLWLGHVMLM
jgi:hypothetical protein